MFTRWDPWSLFNGEIYTLGLDQFEFNILAFSVFVLILTDFLKYFKKQSLTEFLKEQCIWFRWIVVLGLIFGCIVYGVYGINFDSAQFIYFQF